MTYLVKEKQNTDGQGDSDSVKLSRKQVKNTNKDNSWLRNSIQSQNLPGSAQPFLVLPLYFHNEQLILHSDS